MRLLVFVLALVSLMAEAETSAAGEQPSSDRPKQGKKVSSAGRNLQVERLGNDNFGQREQARKQLEAIGEPTLGTKKRPILVHHTMEAINCLGLSRQPSLPPG